MEWVKYCETFKEKVKSLYRRKMGRDCNLENPRTLSEKIQWLKIYDSTFQKSYCADKITLRDYVDEKLNKDICIPIIAIYNKPEDIEWDKLPNRFVIKCNHGSGYNIIVKDKKTLNRNYVNATLHRWLNEDYGKLGYELHYSNIPRKVFIEEYKESIAGDLIDYRFWCYNGIVKYFTINAGHGNGATNYYDLNMNLLPYQRIGKEACLDKRWDKPKSFDTMLNYAKILCKDFKLVRIDFYEIDENPYLGELTFTPCDGFITYTNNGDLEFGKMLDL